MSPQKASIGPPDLTIESRFQFFHGDVFTVIILEAFFYFFQVNRKTKPKEPTGFAFSLTADPVVENIPDVSFNGKLTSDVENLTFTLVDGKGDDDNGLFKIEGKSITFKSAHTIA